MFRSPSLMALPVLLLPLYGAASELTGSSPAPQDPVTLVLPAQQTNALPASALNGPIAIETSDAIPMQEIASPEQSPGS